MAERDPDDVSGEPWLLLCARCGKVHCRAATFELAVEIQDEAQREGEIGCLYCGRRRFKIQHGPSAARYEDPANLRMPSWQDRAVKPGSTLFVLGAGFSVEAGVPLAEGFFQREIGDSAPDKRTFVDQEMLPRVKRIPLLRNEVARLHAAAGKPPPRIDEVFAIVNAYCDANPGEDFRNLRYDLLFYISMMLQDACLPYLDAQVLKGAATTPYNRFAAALAKASNRSSVICLNYDPVLEFAFARLQSHNIDYGIWRAPADLNLTGPLAWTDRSYTILKLHGSTNWLQCWNCGNIYFKGLSHDLPQASFFGTHDWCRRCRSAHVLPLLVAPEPRGGSDYQESALSDMVAMALLELRVARRAVFIGYSLPDYDVNLRLLFMHTLLVENPSLKEVVVVDPSEETLERYRQEVDQWRTGRPLRLIRQSFAEFANGKALDEVLAA